MTRSLLTLIFLSFLLVACVPPTSQVLSGSSDAQTLRYAEFNGSTNAISGMSAVGGLYVQYGNMTGVPLNITIYGYTSANVSQVENIIVNSSFINYTALQYANISRVTLNQSALLGVAFYENSSRTTLLLNITPGNTSAYIGGVADGVFPDLAPLTCVNSSIIGVKAFTEFGLYGSCMDVGTAVNVTPYLSPDGTTWFAGTIMSCDNNRSITPMDSEGVQFIMFNACTYDRNTTQAYIAVSAK